MDPRPAPDPPLDRYVLTAAEVRADGRPFQIGALKVLDGVPVAARLWWARTPWEAIPEPTRQRLQLADAARRERLAAAPPLGYGLERFARFVGSLTLVAADTEREALRGAHEPPLTNPWLDGCARLRAAFPDLPDCAPATLVERFGLRPDQPNGWELRLLDDTLGISAQLASAPGEYIPSALTTCLLFHLPFREALERTPPPAPLP